MFESSGAVKKSSKIKNSINVKNSINNKISTNIKNICLIVACIFLLTGCGEDESLNEYKENMETFFNNVAQINDNMNSIDISGEGYVEEMLGYLDSLNDEVSWMAELEVPEEFESVESLADDASENMSQAVSFYHMAYEAEEFDADMEDAAHQYYDRANTIIQYIITILHGEIPEGEGVTFTQEDKIFGEGYMNEKDDTEEETEKRTEEETK